MGNIDSLAKAHEAQMEFEKQLERERALQELRQEEFYRSRIAALERQNKLDRARFRALCKEKGIKYHHDDAIMIEKDGEKHVFTIFNWFANSSSRAAIERIMNHFGEPVVTDNAGNPTNDVVWHFDTFLREMLKVLEAA